MHFWGGGGLGTRWMMLPSRWQQAISSGDEKSLRQTEALKRGHTGGEDEPQSSGEPSSGFNS